MKQQQVRLGFIGTGGRGCDLLEQILPMEDVAVPAVSDLNPQNRTKAQDLVEQSGRPRPDAYADYQELLDRTDIQGVVIGSGWKAHLRISMAAMRKGVVAAPEVGPANSVEECWALVRTYEETGVSCMMLENYCFAPDMMCVLHMVREGVFGEVVHCEAGYQHELQERLVLGKGTGTREKGTGDYRSVQNLKRNGDLYPTHGLGPLAKILDIHAGNRFLKLTSTASKARGLADWSATNLPAGHAAAHSHWAKGDVVTTVLTCANGETVILKLLTTIPAPMSRLGRLHGTRGVWVQESEQIYLEGKSPKHEWEGFQAYAEAYDHPLWQAYREHGVRSGHWGGDYVMLRLLVESIAAGRPTPIDAYDTAAWMAVGPLSEDSIALGGSPVAFPDFTGGEWIDWGRGTLPFLGREYGF